MSVDDEDPKVRDVVVTGTQVKSNFQETGSFRVSVTPLDGGGNGILSTDLDVDVELRHGASKAMAKTHTIGGDVEIDTTKEGAENGLTAPIVLDGSGSMENSDPEPRLRVAGAKAFVEELERREATFEAAVFEFPGGNETNPGFEYTDIFAGLTSDADSLENGAERTEADGNTPMYGSLEEILEYIQQERPETDKAIVLLGDGKPDDAADQQSVCDLADTNETPIFGIGIGPASDLEDESVRDGEAIAEMRGISECTGGAYQGLARGDTGLEGGEEAFEAVATSSSEGSLQMKVTVNSGLDQLESGDVVEGTVTVESGDTSKTGDFSFRVPDASKSTARSFQYE